MACRAELWYNSSMKMVCHGGTGIPRDVMKERRISSMSTILPSASKTCTRCLKLKPLSDFAPDGRRHDDHRPYCKECARKKPLIAPWLKECSRCGRILPQRDFFPRNDGRSKDGLSYYCRECDRVASKQISYTIISEKKCSKCGVVKPVADFHSDLTNKDALKSRCKICCSTRKQRTRLKDGYKVCNKCRQEKPLSEFYPARENKSSGVRGRCRDCDLVRRRDYSLRLNYGISLKEYEELFTQQNGVCAICKQPGMVVRYGKELSLHVDHCHTTGAVRGLLCSQCNTALGQLREDPEIIESLLAYVRERVLF